ncbi:DsbA family oxidoreductase [Algoriphagus machipongonensis]|uniref:Dithiol-disulfide isomerase n=1 Tax=Algoriphagus machipongonensis TaxID=388413 RepID=A3HSU7_9BACT|nr:DsbA family oxidoreductase [Algoriphagus machipongonensis]EAZ82915.1 dithiol-disulfide isomerase [Algoriphagus machipongonensis]
MKIEIWSDVVCPFCYIGKRKLEQALDNFPQKDQIEIEWKSFQLNPDLKTDPSLSSLEYLSKSKGWSMPQTIQITQQVVDMANEVGLEYHLDKTVVANTMNAHRLIHLAKESNNGGEMKERLLKAYFTEGKNVDDSEILISLGTEVGLDADRIKQMLNSDEFENAVRQDIYESQQVGVKGVPFFVLDRKFGISGAQPDQVFTQTLEKAWEDYKKSNPVINMVGDGDSCDVDGENC